VKHSTTLALILPALMVPLAWSGQARAEVLFENPGNKMGWGRVFTQKAGTIDEVSSPVYKGTTAVKTTQTYQKSDGANYHSEIIKEKAHLAGQDLYYGHAVYLPPDWVFHNQNVTFQQWAPEMPEAPWILMYLQNDRVRLGGRGAMGDKDVGPVTGLRGTWMRVVTRIHFANPGLFEVWINGQKFFSQKGNFRPAGPSMRWSNGIYATRWDTETPTGPRELSIWHDNMRIATTYEEADPATWGEGGPSPTDAGASPDAEGPMVPADAGEPMPADARATPQDTGAGGTPGTGGAGGVDEPDPETGGSGGGPPRSSTTGSGCRYGSGAGADGRAGLAVFVALALALRGRRRTR
jgi:hypothetical protein